MRFLLVYFFNGLDPFKQMHGLAKKFVIPCRDDDLLEKSDDFYTISARPQLDEIISKVFRKIFQYFFIKMKACVFTLKRHLGISDIFWKRSIYKLLQLVFSHNLSKEAYS